MITKDMTIASILGKDPALAEILLASGMHCLGCAMAHNETLEQACNVHGVDADALTAQLNGQLTIGD